MNNQPKKPKKLWRRLLLVIPGGCLTLILAMVVVNWFTLRSLRGPRPRQPAPAAAWEEALGSRKPGGDSPVSIAVGEPMGVFVLPQVLSVADALEWDGSWILLDRRLGKIHFLDPETGEVESWGRKGEGPGELQSPAALARADTLLWVLNRQGLYLDRFSLLSGFQGRRRITGGGCMVGIGPDLTALQGGDLILMRTCPPTLPGPGAAWLEGLSPDGILTSRFSLPLGDEGSRRLVFGRMPVLASAGEDLYLGTMDAPCLIRWTSGGEREDGPCLPSYHRPPTPTEGKARMENRFRNIDALGFLPLEVPDELPWFDRIFATSRGLVFRRFRSEMERDLVLLPHNGPPSVTEVLFPENTFVGEETLLSVRDRMQGTEITVYRSPWAPNSVSATPDPLQGGREPAHHPESL